MEKLQPVIKQIFWICFSLAVLLILFGWWSAKGELATQTETRRTAVETAFNEAGQNVGSVPNSRWTEGGTKINEAHERDFQLSAMRLYERQIKARTYPVQIEKELDRLKFNSIIQKMALRERFAQVYASYFRDQMAVIKPFEDGKGLVDIEGADITYTTFSSKRPTSAEIWKAQEDIWLLRSILDSIAAVNEGYERIDKAPIRQLQLLQLRGGDRDAPIGGGGAVGGFSSGGETEDAYGGFGGAAQAGGSGAYAAYEGSLTSDLLNEEFGSVSGMGGGTSDYMDEGSGGFASTEPAEENRYVDDDEDFPYRTRAFALNVKILQEEVPILLGELTNSYFPVEIVRVDIAFASGHDAGATGYGGGDSYEEGYGDEGGYEDLGGGSGFGGSGFGGAGFGGGGMRTGIGGKGGSPLTATPKRSRKPLTAKQQKAVKQGERFLAAGLSDSNLCSLRVAGLMTLYRSPAENEAEAETAAHAEEETEEAGAADPGGPPLQENPLEDAAMDDAPAADGDSEAQTPDTSDESAATSTQDDPDAPADAGNGSGQGTPAPEPSADDGASAPDSDADLPGGNE